MSQSTASSAGVNRSLQEIKLEKEDIMVVSQIEEAMPAADDTDSTHLFDWENYQRPSTPFGTFYLSNNMMVKTLLEELTLQLKVNKIQFSAAEDGRAALICKISDDIDFPLEEGEEEVFQDVEVSLKQFKIEEDAAEGDTETRVQVCINCLNGSSSTYANFVKSLMKSPDSEGSNAGVLNKYDDCTL